MATTVYIWRTGGGSSNTAGAGSSLRRLSGQPFLEWVSNEIGGFGHVAVEIAGRYTSYWPPEFEDEVRSVSLTHSEDTERCGREADRRIAIGRLGEAAMITAWEEWSQDPFDEITHNCCTMSSRLLYRGTEAAAFRDRVRATALATLDPLRSLWETYHHAIREETIHDPRQVERFADHLADLY